MEEFTVTLTKNEIDALCGLLWWYTSRPEFIENSTQEGNWVIPALNTSYEKFGKVGGRTDE